MMSTMETIRELKDRNNSWRPICGLMVAIVSVAAFVIYLAHVTRRESSAVLTTCHKFDGNENSTVVLDELSMQLARTVEAIQSRPCSKTTALYCGHSDSCGFGCQIHHRIACMIFSYSFDMPMIHNDKKNWSFDDPWEKYFKKIGSNCSTTSVAKLIDVNWFNLSHIRLDKGIPLPKEFAQKLGQNHANPFLWLIGQFANLVFQPNDEASELIEKFKKSLGISKEDLNGSSLIGMHVRRTDKYLSETKVRLHAADFMKAAIAFRNEKLIDPAKQLTIFLATEDHDAITEFRSTYENSHWKFVTGSITTFADPKSRSSQLFEIVRDIQVLVDSDYLICTYSSNICRLALELRSTNSQYLNPECYVMSLDGKYSFVLLNRPIAGRINPI